MQIPNSRIARVRKVCIAFGVLMLASAAVLAEDGRGGGPSWEGIATGLVGVLSLVVGAYARGLERRVGNVETGLKGLNDRVLSDYHDARDTEHAIALTLKPIEVILAHLQSEIAAIHKRLDRMNVPQASGTGQNHDKT